MVSYISLPLLVLVIAECHTHWCLVFGGFSTRLSYVMLYSISSPSSSSSS